MKKIAKFGGSTVCDATHLSILKAVIKENDYDVVVLSAPHDTEGRITDALMRIYQASDVITRDSLFDSVASKFQKIKDDLNLEFDVKNYFRFLKRELESHITLEYFVSRGEYLIGKLIAEYINYQFIDASEVICFNEDDTIDEINTFNRIQFLPLDRKWVLPGFYGSFNKHIRLMSRGGGDLTGSLVASALNASYDNYKDVEGVYDKDPKIFHDAKFFDYLSYDKLEEIIDCGSQVFQKDAIKPLKKHQIELTIKSVSQTGRKTTVNDQRERSGHTYVI